MDAISNIGRIDVWFSIIETCKVEGHGPGALRYMTITGGGGEIRDTIEDIDSKNIKLVYLRPISPFPVTYYRGTVEVRGGSVCLNRFSDLISGIPALVMKVMDPRSGTA